LYADFLLVMARKETLLTWQIVHDCQFSTCLSRKWNSGNIRSRTEL